MRMVKKLLLLLLVAAPCFLPVPSRAGNGNDQGQNQDQDQGKKIKTTSPTTTNNSVPLNEGVVFLTLAGLALGARLIYNARAKKEVASH